MSTIQKLNRYDVLIAFDLLASDGPDVAWQPAGMKTKRVLPGAFLSVTEGQKAEVGRKP